LEHYVTVRIVCVAEEIHFQSRVTSAKIQWRLWCERNCCETNEWPDRRFLFVSYSVGCSLYSSVSVWHCIILPQEISSYFKCAYRLEHFDLEFIKTEPSCSKSLLIRAKETGVPIISMSSGRLFHGTDARQVVVPFGCFIRIENCGTNACHPLFKNRFNTSSTGATHPEHYERNKKPHTKCKPNQAISYLLV
jgi:hypothetical protein